MIIGIDTGVSGGMALYSGGALIGCCEVPTYWLEVAGKTRNGNKKRRRKIDYVTLNHILSEWIEMGAKHMIIEHVHSVPRDSPIAAFSFGEAFGCFTAIGHALKLDVHHVSPQKWKTAMGLIGEEKNASLDKARLAFGKEFFKNKKDHNKAEAALIAVYGQSIIGK